MLTNIIKALSTNKDYFNYRSRIALMQTCQEIHTAMTTETDFFPCLHQEFESIAAKYPDEIAIIDPHGNKYSYKTINQRANQWAHYFQGLIQKGQQVGLFMPMSVDYIILQLALLKCGIAFIPLTTNRKTPITRLHQYMRHEKAMYVITNKIFSNHIFIKTLHKSVIIVENLSASIDDYDDKNLDILYSHNELAYIMNSSGSTGEPKQALISHKGLVPFIKSLTKAMRVNSTSCMAALADVAFDAHLAELWCAFIKGARVQIITAEDHLKPQKFKHLYQEVTHGMFTPSVLSRLDESVLEKLEVILSTGEVLTNKELKKWALNRVFIDGYGPMESTIGCYFWIYENGELVSAMCSHGTGIMLGRFDQDAWCSDKEDPILKDQTDLGEVYIYGIGLAQGYTDTALTKSAFVTIQDHHGKSWRAFKTGDLGRWQNGQLKLMGRTNRQFKIHGRLIHALEIENIIKKSGLVKWVYVDGEQHKGAYQTRLFAHIVLEHEGCDLFELNHYLKQNFYADISPAYWLIHKEQPVLSGNLKVERQQLAKLRPKKVFLSGVSDYVDEKYDQLTALWLKVLCLKNENRYQPRIDDDFFKLGGSSLSASDLIAAVNQQFNKKISITAFMNSPTLFFLITQIDDTLSMDKCFRTVQEFPESEHGPVIFIHTLMCDADEDFGKLYQHFDAWQRNIYSLSAPGLQHGYHPNVMAEIVRVYAPFIRKVTKPNQIPVIITWSAGGAKAIEISIALLKLGILSIVVMLDSEAPAYFQGMEKTPYSEYLWALYTYKLKRANYPMRADFENELQLDRYHPIRQVGLFFDKVIKIDQRYNQGRQVNKLKSIRSEMLLIYNQHFDCYPPNVHLWYADDTLQKRRHLPNGARLCWSSELNFASEPQRLSGNHESIILNDHEQLAKKIIAFVELETALLKTEFLNQQLSHYYRHYDRVVNQIKIDTVVQQLPKMEGAQLYLKPSIDNACIKLSDIAVNAWLTGAWCPHQCKRMIVVKLSSLKDMPPRQVEHTIVDLLSQLPWIDKSGFSSFPNRNVLNEALKRINQKHLMWVIEDDRQSSETSLWESPLADAIFNTPSAHVVFISSKPQLKLGERVIDLFNAKTIDLSELPRVDAEPPVLPSTLRLPTLKYLNFSKIKTNNLHNIPMQGPSGVDTELLREAEIDVAEDLSVAQPSSQLTGDKKHSGNISILFGAKIKVGGKMTLPTPEKVMQNQGGDVSLAEKSDITASDIIFDGK